MYLLLNAHQEQSYDALPNASAKQSHAAGIGIHHYRSHQALRRRVFNKNRVVHTRKQQIEMPHFGVEEGPSRSVEVAA